MMRPHLWWNGYDHAPGETAEDARRWLSERSGLPEDDCEGEGWDMLPDNTLMRDDGGDMGSLTATEYAKRMGSMRPWPRLRLVVSNSFREQGEGDGI